MEFGLPYFQYKEIWEYGTTERLELCEKLRLRANDLVKEQQYALAQAKYQRIWNNLFGDKNISDKEQNRERDRLYIAANLNMALCMIKRQMTPFEAVKHCTYVVELEPDNVKAYYRRGQARMLQDDYEEAMKDFRKVMELDPSNAAARRELLHCREGSKIYARMQMLTYRSLFRFDKHKRDPKVYDDDDLTPEQRRAKVKEERKLQKEKEKAAKKKKKEIAKAKARKNKGDSDDETTSEEEDSEDSSSSEESSSDEESTTSASSGKEKDKNEDGSSDSDSSSDTSSDSKSSASEAKAQKAKAPAILKSIDRFKIMSRQSGMTNASSVTPIMRQRDIAVDVPETTDADAPASLPAEHAENIDKSAESSADEEVRDALALSPPDSSDEREDMPTKEAVPKKTLGENN